MLQSSRDQEAHLECLVAAILTVAAVDTRTSNPTFAVRQYAETLQKLRESGGAVNPEGALYSPP